MKAKRTIGFVAAGLFLMLTFTLSARSGGDRDRGDQGWGWNHHDRDEGDRDRDKECLVSEHHEDNLKTPVKLIGAILVPGSPITSADIAWVDPGTERYYIADRSNAGVDIIDADDDVWVGRVGGFVGNPPAPNTGGGGPLTNGPGPNGVVVTPNRRLWAGDGNSTVQVADVDPNSPAFGTLLKPGGISTVTAHQLMGTDGFAICDGGTATTHYCGRTDELAYDPTDKIILIANNAPLSLSSPHGPVDPFVSFINAEFPYNVLAQVTFKGAGGVEQPLWDSELQRFALTVPGNTGVTPATLHILNPKTFADEATYAFDCQSLANVASVSITGIALAPYQHFLVSACGFPVLFTLNAATHTIHPLNVITSVGGGDEVWYNPGDGRFFVTGPDMTPTGGGVQSLGVIDAETSSLLQLIPDVKGKNTSAFPENNHIFTVVTITAAIVKAPSTDDSVCNAKFGFAGTGCIAVFEHTESGEAKAQ